MLNCHFPSSIFLPLQRGLSHLSARLWILLWNKQDNKIRATSAQCSNMAVNSFPPTSKMRLYFRFGSHRKGLLQLPTCEKNLLGQGRTKSQSPGRWSSSVLNFYESWHGFPTRLITKLLRSLPNVAPSEDEQKAIEWISEKKMKWHACSNGILKGSTFASWMTSRQ